jgi:hypothetical protein
VPESLAHGTKLGASESDRKKLSHWFHPSYYGTCGIKYQPFSSSKLGRGIISHPNSKMKDI